MLTSKCFHVLYAVTCAYTTVTSMVLPNSDKTSIIRSQDGYITSQPKDRAIAAYIPLRILPLGASITHGVASSDGNGYRQDLREQLVALGTLVNMVGSNPNGTMKDNDNSGWPGFIIDQTHAKSNIDTPNYKPNLVLINLGTNDAIQSVDIPNAGNRMSSMIDDIYTQSPQVTIILSSLIVNADTATQARGVNINTQYQALATELRNAGKPLVYADMQTLAGPSLSDLSPDGIHPLDRGYQKMANIWLTAISQANAQGFLRPAEDNGIPADGGS